MNKIFTLLFALLSSVLWSQKSFTIKVEVIDRYTDKPIKNAVVHTHYLGTAVPHSIHPMTH